VILGASRTVEVIAAGRAVNKIIELFSSSRRA